MADLNLDGDWDDTDEQITLDSDTSGLDFAANDEFGVSVAVSQSKLLVRAKDDSDSNEGVVYILEDQDGDGDYNDSGDSRKLDENTEGVSLSDDYAFGQGLAVSNNLIAVGVPLSDDTGTEKGIVYILKPKYTATLTATQMQSCGG